MCPISPFLSFDYGKDSYIRNKRGSCLTLQMAEGFNENFKPKGMSDEVAVKDPGLSSADAEIGWWKDAPVERMMLVWGAYEVFADDNAALGRKLVEEVEAGEGEDFRG
jgi:hypothetical protein